MIILIKKIEGICTALHCKPDDILKFIAEDENVWMSMVDYLTVHHDGKVEFTFLDGGKTELKR